MSHLSESEIQGLKNKAKNLRIDIIKMITKSKFGTYRRLLICHRSADFIIL